MAELNQNDLQNSKKKKNSNTTVQIEPEKQKFYWFSRNSLVSYKNNGIFIYDNLIFPKTKNLMATINLNFV